MSGLAIVLLVLLAQVVLGVIAAVVGARWFAARQARRDHPGGGLRRENPPLPPYPSDDRADRELYAIDR
ncbi:MAG: hypothetical protein GEV07_00815 [Streptosporangiales bacterium]|nr:hypothetical protein [Streptosporangiales bacterium]